MLQCLVGTMQYVVCTVHCVAGTLQYVVCTVYWKWHI